MPIYLIWKDQEDRNVAGVKDIIGVFIGDYEEANAIVDRLNREDSDVKTSMFGKIRYGYWKQEAAVITSATVHEFLPQ